MTCTCEKDPSVTCPRHLKRPIKTDDLGCYYNLLEIKPSEVAGFEVRLFRKGSAPFIMHCDKINLEN